MSYFTCYLYVCRYFIKQNIIFFQNLVQFCNYGNFIRIETDRSFRGKYKDFPKYFSVESLFKTLEKDLLVLLEVAAVKFTSYQVFGILGALKLSQNFVENNRGEASI